MKTETKHTWFVIDQIKDVVLFDGGELAAYRVYNLGKASGINKMWCILYSGDKSNDLHIARAIANTEKRESK